MSEGLVHPEPFRLRLPTPDRTRLAGRATAVAGALTAAMVPVLGRRLIARSDRLATARALERSCDQLGATFLKIGQIVASAPGMFGDDVAGVFRSCLDTGPTVPIDQIRVVIENDLGRPLSEAFADLDPEPLGQASLAVVHRATTIDGQEVAVKILRPAIEDLVAADLAIVGPIARTLADRLGMEAAGALDATIDGLREQLEEELDLRNERRTLDHHRQVLATIDAPDVVIPHTHPELSGRRVLTMELLDGVPIDDEATAAALGVDLAHVTRQLLRYWFACVLREGTFHADVHAGNLLALRDGRLGLVDWGIVGRLDAETHTFFRQAVGAMLGDDDAWDDLAAYLESTYGPVLAESMGASGAELGALLRKVFEPFFTQPFSAFTLAQLMQQMPHAQGLSRGGERRSARQLRQHWRQNRRIRTMGNEHGVRELPFNRGMMMLVKQLLYFERYGQLFLADSALLDDADHYARLLASSQTGVAETEISD